MRGEKSLKSALKRHAKTQAYQDSVVSKQKNREANEKARKRKQAPPKKVWIPFDQANLCVFIGEANFSFARNCLEENYVGATIATNYDSLEDLQKKYPEVEANMQYLQEDARVDAVQFSVDATNLSANKELMKQINDFKAAEPVAKIDFCFNFPHLGASIANQDRNIRAHQQLMLAFFKQVKAVPDARAIVALFEGEPYVSWEIKKLAREAGLKVERSGAFEWDAFKTYSHCLTAKTGNTHKVQRERNARVYVFV